MGHGLGGIVVGPLVAKDGGLCPEWRLVPLNELAEGSATLARPAHGRIEHPLKTALLPRNVTARPEPMSGTSGKDIEHREQNQQTHDPDDERAGCSTIAAHFISLHATNSTDPRMKKPQRYGLGGFGADAEEWAKSTAPDKRPQRRFLGPLLSPP